MQVWNLLHSARWKHRTQKVAKNRHLGTIAQLCWAISSQLRHVSTIGKKLVKQQYVLHMSPQYGELRPTNGWDPFVSLGHSCKFQRVSRLGSVTSRHIVVVVSQTLRRWTEGATYVRQGDHHVGHWPTFWYSYVFLCVKCLFVGWLGLWFMSALGGHAVEFPCHTAKVLLKAHRKQWRSVAVLTLDSSIRCWLWVHRLAWLVNWCPQGQTAWH